MQRVRVALTVEEINMTVLASLEVYDQVQHLPDLTQRLLGEAATPNLHVDIVPAHGNVASMATRAAVGTPDVSSRESPHGVTPRRVKPNQNSRVVKITSVDSPSLVVPGLKKVLNKEGVCLRDFGVPPFLIILPLKMLKHHVDSHLVRIFTDAELGSAAGENSDMYVATNTAPTRAAQPQPAIKHSQQCDALYFSETDDRFNHDTHGATNNIGDSDGDEYEPPPGMCLTSEALDLVALARVVGDQAGGLEIKYSTFNKRAWSKANNVLKEVLNGFYSDPPGISFYTNRLNKQGEPMVDQYGLSSLLDCNRGQMMLRPFTSN
ncbi:hypothetical protein MHU86_10224 [Fragilaria crotonensis]|nr:hypothetical protein MHU86_10224 [Fragilaria crotonensis]